MYYFLLELPADEKVELELPRAEDPGLCETLAFERDPPKSLFQLTFHLDPSCPKLDYLPIKNVPFGKLCSQHFIDVLTSASVPFRAYPVQMLERNTEQPIVANYFFCAPKRIKDAIDWERSEEWVQPNTGTRWLTKLVLTAESETSAPLLFQTRGRYLVHHNLYKQLQETGITGITCAPLDAAYDPFIGVKRLELENILQEHPDDWQRWCQLSEIFVSTQRFEDAIEPLQRAIALKPDLREAWERRGYILHALGHLEEALEALKYAIQLKPQIRMYSVVLRGIGDHEEKRKDAEHLLQMRAWNEYSTVLRELGRNEEALACAQHLIQTWSDSPLPWYELGSVYTALEDDEKALQAIEHGLALGGGARLKEMLSTKGELLSHLGRYEEALAIYEVGLRRNPRDKIFWAGKVKALHALERDEEMRIAERKMDEFAKEREEHLKKRPL